METPLSYLQSVDESSLYWTLNIMQSPIVKSVVCESMMIVVSLSAINCVKVYPVSLMQTNGLRAERQAVDLVILLFLLFDASMSFKLITIANVVTAVCDCITSRERMLQCCMIRVKVHFVRALIDRCATYCSPPIMVTTSSATFLACLKPCLCVDCSLH